MRGSVLAGLIFLGLGVAGVLMVLGAVGLAELDYQWQRWREARGGVAEWVLWQDFRWEVPSEQARAGLSLKIPDILVDVAVVPQVDAADKGVYGPALQQGVVQAKGSAAPGKGGLGFYFAHSSSLQTWRNPSAAVFYRLGKVEVGDMVYLDHEEEEYAYRVVEKEVIAADDTAFLARETEGNELVVLQTCWPIGTNWKRLNVYAERVE